MAMPDRESNVETAPDDGRLFVQWLEGRADPMQIEIGRKQFELLLGHAAQPRHVSGDACIKLCYFVQQCRDSKMPCIRDLVFSQNTCLDMFNFFLEWNEKNQNRSMRQVLELLSSLLATNPYPDASASLKGNILRKIVSIITHKAAQPLVKPAFKSLECFIAKTAVSIYDLIQIYADESSLQVLPQDRASRDLIFWNKFMSETFEWMASPDVSPAAGKFLVTVFGQLRRQPNISEKPAVESTLLWQRWVRDGLSNNPEALENVKNHLFSPLFKLDRSGSLAFLGELNQKYTISETDEQGLHAHSLLQLAAMEVGKKAGLVEESSAASVLKPAKKGIKCIILKEEMIEPLLSHASNLVRSLSFSVLVSSSSSTKPFNLLALNILRRHLAPLHADTDAKFRNEILSQTKHMITRIKGATASLEKELQRLSFSHNLAWSSQSSLNDITMNGICQRLEHHTEFVSWYIGFLLGELVPTASYQRHITALKAVQLLQKSGILAQKMYLPQKQISDNVITWPFRVDFFTTGCTRLLLDLLMDPFEDVRVNAALVLRLTPSEAFIKSRAVSFSENIKPASGDNLSDTRRGVQDGLTTSKSLSALTYFITRASEMSKRTGRADYADGLARCYELLYGFLETTEARFGLVQDLVSELEERVSMAEKDLSNAVIDFPVHGTLASLSFIWESIVPSSDYQDSASEKQYEYYARWNEIQQQIYSLCKRMWLVVKDVLCNDSPEGHMPEDLDELDTIDTKDVLSYSFRATHESSNLMKNIANKINCVWHNGAHFLPISVFVGIGNLTFEQLSSLRHRGAFSTVSLTFSRCCQLTEKHSTVIELSKPQLLQTWYKGALTCVLEQVSTTRRSAGIPALLTGIMSAHSNNPSFSSVMDDLKTLARQPAILSDTDQTNLPQVHAMNCLKEVFRSSTLGKRADGHLAECLQLAADSLSSEIWAIRNCALILLRSLIDCLFGTNDGKTVTEAGWDGRSIKISYDSYPPLPDLLLKLLKAGAVGFQITQFSAVGAVESVFPALDIIRRAGPPPSNRDQIYQHVSLYLGSKIWHVREIAARTICSMMLHQNWLAALTDLIESANKSTNRLHGVLMAVRFVLERRMNLGITTTTDDISHILFALRIPLPWDFIKYDSPEVLAAYLELGNTIAQFLLSRQKDIGASDHQYSLKACQDIFADDAFEEFIILTHTYKKSIQSRGGVDCDLFATLGNTICRRAIYTAALAKDEDALQKLLPAINELGVDITLATLECVSDKWTQGILCFEAGVSEAYINLINITQSSEVGATALMHLVRTLISQATNSGALHDLGVRKEDDGSSKRLDLRLLSLQASLSETLDTPSLDNSRIAVGGFILLAEYASTKSGKTPIYNFNKHLFSWGQSLSIAGDANSNFDTRYAAATALASVYANLQYSKDLVKNHYAIQSLFALYDSLNDDDDEVRDLSAETTSSIIGSSLLPLAASTRLVKLLHGLHGKSRLYISNIICRMTGNDVSMSFEFESEDFSLVAAEAQLLKAMKNDDSLFVEEEQNLFIDEVRETKLWCSIFEEVQLADWSPSDVIRVWRPAYFILATWVLEGLRALNRLLGKEDGPLGWTSKPAVFAICMRVVLGTNAVLAQHNSTAEAANDGPAWMGDLNKGIIAARDELLEIGQSKHFHESILFALQK